MLQGNFIGVFLARHVPGTYAHHQEHRVFGMGGGLESSCVGRVYGADGAVRRNSTSNALDDGRIYPKHVKLGIRQ